MKYVFSFFSPLITLLSCGNWKYTSSFTYEALSVSDFQHRLNETSDYMLIDVRTMGEYSLN